MSTGSFTLSPDCLQKGFASGRIWTSISELPEFNRDALEVLRQPLEDGVVSVSRVSASYIYPADFCLVAAMNPCPCGYYGDVYRQCSCNNTQVQKYQKRISGPLLDRIDLHIEVPRLSEEELL